MSVDRILMTTDAVGGVWNYSLRLAAALSDLGKTTHLAVMGPSPSESQLRDARELSKVALHQGRYRLEWMEDPWEEVAAAGDWLLHLEETLTPDVVHLNGYVHGSLPWAAPVCVVAHSCVLSWWEAVRHEAAPAEWVRYRLAVARGLRCAKHVIAPTAAMLQNLRRHYGNVPNITIVPNGVCDKAFRPQKKHRVVFSAGRLWDAAKNIETLAACAGELEWPVVIGGAGCYEASKNVLLLGQLPQKRVAEWMAIASIYCLPARYEPFGLSILEAALSGCALVLGDISSLRELWDDAAVFVAPDDSESLKAALRQLIRNQLAREQLVRRSLQRAKEFTVERMANGYLKVYDRVAVGGENLSRHSLDKEMNPAATSQGVRLASRQKIAE